MGWNQHTRGIYNKPEKVIARLRALAAEYKERGLPGAGAFESYIKDIEGALERKNAGLDHNLGGATKDGARFVLDSADEFARLDEHPSEPESDWYDPT